MSTVKLPYHSHGSLVTIKMPFLGEPAGTICYVYEVYGTEGGISLITQNGVDLSGFSLRDQALFLHHWGDTKQVYHFKSVMQLAADWRAGVFKPIFDHLEKFKHERKARRTDN